MTNRIAAAMFLAAGTCCLAQEVIVVSTAWTEMLAGTNTPILNPNGRVEPGEGAMVEFGTHALRNGTNAVGQVVSQVSGGVTYTGPIASFGSYVYDLQGSGEATGTWNHRLMSPMYTFFPNLGIIQQNGARLMGIGSAQMVGPGAAPVDPTNPVTLVWRGVWNPSSYETRTVHFALEPSVMVPEGEQNSMLVHVGQSPEGFALYLGRYFQTDFGPGWDIPVGPGLSGLQQVCYPNCDGSTGAAVLNVGDFVCYFNLFAAGNSIANCDGSVRQPLLTANDFMCYINKYASACP